MVAGRRGRSTAVSRPISRAWASEEGRLGATKGSRLGEMTELSGTGRGRDPFVTVEVDAQLVVRAWNVRAEQAFGAGPEAAIGRPIAALVPVVGGDTRWRAMLVEDDAAYAWPLADDAAQRSFEWVHTCLYDADGRVRGAICYGRDVTERVEAIRRLELDHRILTTIVDTVHISLWAIDAGGLFTMMTGGPTSAQASSVVGRSIFEMYGDNPGTVNLRRALAGEAQHNFASTGGQEWESWMVPIPTQRPTDPAVVGISLDITEARRREHELRDKLDLIERQQQAIRAMSTPIIEVWDRVLCLPILGLVDGPRAAEIMDSLLQAVTRVRARFAILDMTGVEVIDTSTASHLLGLVQAIQLLGAQGVITGIHPNIAQTMVNLGMDLSRIIVRANLREALKLCITQPASGRR